MVKKMNLKFEAEIKLRKILNQSKIRIRPTVPPPSREDTGQ